MHITWSKKSFHSPFDIVEKENWTNKLRSFSCFRQRKLKGTLIQGQNRSRKNPLLYKTLLSLYGHPNCWILDLCSGAGKIADIA